MGGESRARRAVAFLDGQNLYHAAREVFGYTHPNYDPFALARTICARRGWRLEEVRFYTGVPPLATIPSGAGSGRRNSARWGAEE